MGQSRFTIVSMWKFVLVLLFVNYCIILHTIQVYWTTGNLLLAHPAFIICLDFTSIKGLQTNKISLGERKSRCQRSEIGVWDGSFGVGLTGLLQSCVFFLIISWREELKNSLLLTISHLYFHYQILTCLCIIFVVFYCYLDFCFMVMGTYEGTCLCLSNSRRLLH